MASDASELLRPGLSYVRELSCNGHHLGKPLVQYPPMLLLMSVSAFAPPLDQLLAGEFSAVVAARVCSKTIQRMLRCNEILVYKCTAAFQ